MLGYKCGGVGVAGHHHAGTAQPLQVGHADTAQRVVPEPFRQGDRDGGGEAVTAEVHKNLHRITLPVQDIGRAGTIQVGEPDMGGVELASKVQPAKVHRLAKSSTPQVWEAAHGLPGNMDQMLLPRSQQVTERHQFAAFVVDHWQGRFSAQAVDLDGVVETLVGQIDIQAHAARPDHRQVRQAVAHQAGQLCLGVKKLAGEGRVGREVAPLLVGIEGEKARNGGLGHQPVELAVAIDVCEHLQRWRVVVGDRNLFEQLLRRITHRVFIQARHRVTNGPPVVPGVLQAIEDPGQAIAKQVHQLVIIGIDARALPEGLLCKKR